MDILRKYAEEQGYDYQQLLSDYYSSPKQEQDMFMAQLGGQQPQPEQPQGGGDQVMQIIQMFAQLTGEDPQAIMDQLQQLPPEQQQAAIEEMVAAIQQTQQQAQYGGKFGLKKKSIPVTSNGYYEYSPENTPQLIVPSGNITMAGIDYPIKATDADTGEYLGIMQPEQEYRFKAKNVLEEPIYAQRANLDRSKSMSALLDKKTKEYEKQKRDILSKEKTAANKRKLEQLQVVYDREVNNIKASIANYQNAVKFTEKNISTYNPDSWVKNFFSGRQKPNDSIEALQKLEEDIKFKTENVGKILNLENYNKVPTGASAGDASIQWDKLTGKSIPNFSTSVVTNDESQKQVVTPRIGDANFGLTDDSAIVKSLNKSSVNKTLAPVTQRQRVGSKYLPVKSDKNSWVGDWEKFLVGQGILDGDKTYSVNDIDDTVAEYVKNNSEFYKDNKYIGQKDFGSLLKDGIYGKVHESVRPPSGLSTTSDRWKLPEDIKKSDSITTRPTRFDKDPITGRIPATGGVAPKAIKSPDESVVKPKGQQFKFNTRNMLQGLVAQQNVTQAYQPIALPFRRHIDLEAPQAKMIDENVVLAPIMQAFEKTVANINPNSTTGMAFKSNLFGKLTETIPTVLNDINIKNQEIFNANQMAMASARNQEQQFNINADKTAYNDMLASYANRDAAIGASLQGLSDLATANALDDAKLDGYLLENPYLTESTNFIERLFGNRTFEMDPEYREIVKKTALQIASEKAEADKAKKA